MDYSDLYLTIGYTLVVIIATFLLREKYPERYSIGCILCFFAPAWGQFYEKKKSSILIWFIFVTIESGIRRNTDVDLQVQLAAWIVISTMSSVVMYFRLRTGKSAKYLDKKVCTENTADNIDDINTLKERILIKNISYEEGISRIGVIIGFLSALSTILFLILNIDYYDFEKNRLFIIFLLFCLFFNTILFIWGLVIVIYRSYIWVKYGFNNDLSYTKFNIFKINNKSWLIIFVIITILICIQLYLLVNKDKYNNLIGYTPPSQSFSIDGCEHNKSDADLLRFELEKFKLIYDKYPNSLDKIQLPYMFFTKIHVQKLTANYYKISLSGNYCDSIYTIESNKKDVTVKKIK